jgi:cytochrome c oxidase subunit I+III
MLITMLGDMTAFISLVFGYFFFWTLRPDFLAGAAIGPGVLWPVIAAVLLLGSWAVTVLARKWNREDRGLLLYCGLFGSAALAVAGSLALIAGPWLTGLDPTAHSYAAIVWVLVLWTVVHIAVGIVMQLYCVARRLAGRMTSRHDIDIHNVALYWHFMALTAVMTVGVIAGFPLTV